jgi:endoglucanase
MGSLKENAMWKPKRPLIAYILIRLGCTAGMILALGASPLAASVQDTSIVDLVGRLRIEGNRLVGENGRAASLRGMSLFWSQWIGKYYTYDCIKWLRDDWKCTVVRAAMAVESGGYLTNPAAEEKKVRTVIDACIDLGIYVIIDWHDHNAHLHQKEAAAFFKKMAADYGDLPNVIYEIYNEPLQISWANLVKPYSEALVNEIRAIDPDNLILIGTPTWSQDVHLAAADPVKGSNLAYTLHYYAATHRQWLRDRAKAAMNAGIALFVSEFGTCESNGSGVLDYSETAKWFDFLEANQVSWCNWSVADKVETSAALKPNASPSGKWAETDLTDSGKLVRAKIVELNLPVLTSIGPAAGAAVREPDCRLTHNYPNPFSACGGSALGGNPGTTIEFELPHAGPVRVDVFDILGRSVAVASDGFLEAGTHRVRWSAGGLPGGIYVYRIKTADAVLTGRMQLTK